MRKVKKDKEKYEVEMSCKKLECIFIITKKKVHILASKYKSVPLFF